jgi:hypothetical protein
MLCISFLRKNLIKELHSKLYVKLRSTRLKMASAEIKSLTERVIALEAIIESLKSGSSDTKPVKAKRTNENMTFNTYVTSIAMKDEFEEYVEEAKKSASEKNEKYEGLKTYNAFIKTLSEHARTKLKAEYDEKKEAGELKKPAKETKSKKSTKASGGAGAGASASASSAASAEASDAEVSKPAPKKSKKAAAEKPAEESASEAETVKKPAPKKGKKAATEKAEESASEAEVAAPAPAAAASEEKPAEKKKIIRRVKATTATDGDE